MLALTKQAKVQCRHATCEQSKQRSHRLEMKGLIGIYTTIKRSLSVATPSSNLWAIPRISSHEYIVTPPTVGPGIRTRWPSRCAHNTSLTRASSRFLTPCVALSVRQPAKSSTDGSTVSRQQGHTLELGPLELKRGISN